MSSLAAPSTGFSAHTAQPTISIARRGKTTPSSLTSIAADKALRQIIDERCRRQRHGADARPSIGGGSLDAIASAFGDSVARLGLSGWVLRAVVLGTVVTVLAGAAMIAVPHADTARHEIGGIVLYEGKPLANGVIEFHRADAVDPADSLQLAIHADSKGIFRAASTDGLPTGRFAVVIRSGSLATARPRDRRIEAVIPSKYQDPASSPLRVSVLEANVGMKFAVHK